MNNIIKDLERLDLELSEIKLNLNDQLNATNTDIKEFHQNLIYLSSKYPEQNEILEFIVFINDRIETNRTDTKEIITESINQLINVKSQIVRKMIQSNSKESKKILPSIESFADVKVIFIFIISLGVVVGLIFQPESFVESIKYIVTIFNSKG